MQRSAHPESDGAGDLSLTVTIQDDAHRAGRRFAFRASRQAESSGDRQPESEVQSGKAAMIADGRTRSVAILDEHDLRNSARFLAGAIAQARPATVLHDPPHREAAVAYRRSEDLGTQSSVQGFRSDKRV
ncbi:MAG TPA: hypothetical protein VFE34_05640 [Dongiaceae bacterium]|nr:hypothetical protein [Dongiaceae bacterium]